MPSDEFSLRYSDLVTGSYDSVDRIVLNAFFPLGHNPGGFRVWIFLRQRGSAESKPSPNHTVTPAPKAPSLVNALMDGHQYLIEHCARWHGLAAPQTTDVSQQLFSENSQLDIRFL